MDSNLFSRLYYAADLVSGRLSGSKCPSCSGRRRSTVARKNLNLGNVQKCESCGLLYRPTFFAEGKAMRLYYSRVYSRQGIATQPQKLHRAEVARQAAAAGKDRSKIVASILAALPPDQQRVGVLGASWGYEMICLERLGVPIYGIETGSERRDFGRAAYALEIYSSPTEAAEAGHRGGVILSSHVLEHIGRLARTLGTINESICPAVQVHITPRVEQVAKSRSSVGREHPLGVTEDFWRRFTASAGLALAVGAHRPDNSEEFAETIAVMASQQFSATAHVLHSAGSQRP